LRTPFDHTGGKNLGLAYNQEMEAIPDDDWACLCDYDIQFLGSSFYRILKAYAGMASKRNYGLLVPMTNRIGNNHQLQADVDTGSHDIIYHRQIASQVLASGNGQIYIKDVTRVYPKISGLVMLTSKKAWSKAGGFAQGFFVDNDYHHRVRLAGLGVGVMSQLYVYHFYRGDGDLSHLPTKADGRPLLNRDIKDRKPRP